MNSQNSWEIIKSKFIENTAHKTLGRYVAINKAANLFVSLRTCLDDWDRASIEFDKDNEVMEAIVHRSQIKEMQDSGVLNK